MKTVTIKGITLPVINKSKPKVKISYSGTMAIMTSDRNVRKK